MHRVAARFLLVTALVAFWAARAKPQGESRDFAFLGLVTREVPRGDRDARLVVLDVYPGSAAEEMGFRAGDEIRALNDFLIHGQRPFVEELRRSNIGAKLRILVRRDGKSEMLTGRIGSYLETMGRYQEMVRERLEGKELPALPGALWWDAAGKEWKEGPRDWKRLRGKVAVIVSFDECPSCQRSLETFAQAQKALRAAGAGENLAFAGVFYSELPDSAGKEKNLVAAGKLLTKRPPPFPVAVAFYPDGSPGAEEREEQVLLHHHGVVILDAEGKVRFLQILARPGAEFLEALQDALEEAAAGTSGREPGEPAPEPARSADE